MVTLEANARALLTAWNAGPFQVACGSTRHWPSTSAICVRSKTPLKSGCDLWARSPSVPRITPAVITGEQTRMRRRACAIRSAIMCAICRPRPGANTRCALTGVS